MKCIGRDNISLYKGVSKFEWQDQAEIAGEAVLNPLTNYLPTTKNVGV